MKINKKDPRHWCYLAVFTLNVVLGLIVRLLIGVKPNTVVLYGHRLNGNLEAMYERMHGSREYLTRTVFLTMDPGYYRVLRAQGRLCRNGLNPRHMISVCRAHCLVTDHGLHSLVLLKALTQIVLIDVWHGIPFKGFDEKDFEFMHGYAAVLVASPSMRRIYTQRFGFNEQQLRVTGYGRTDRLFLGLYDKQELLAKYGLSRQDRLILFAPTWSQDDRQRNEFPFSLSPMELLSTMSEWLDDNRCTLIVRTHLNTKKKSAVESPRVKFLPMEQYSQTEELLFLADALICDWSSIAFDYLVLRRPTLFVDCKAPFKKGFTYGPEYRYGAIVRNLEELKTNLARYLDNVQEFELEYGEIMDTVTREIYDGFLDGSATERYLREISSLCDHGVTSKSLGCG